MGDPVGLIGHGEGGLVDPARGAGGVAPGGGPPGLGAGPSFKDTLIESLKEVDRLQRDATQAVEDLQAGRRTDLEGVILATEKAESAFRMLLSVRNKVLGAYEEIKQMRS